MPPLQLHNPFSLYIPHQPDTGFHILSQLLQSDYCWIICFLFFTHLMLLLTWAKKQFLKSLKESPKFYAKVMFSFLC